ncbi:hypothetical protein H2203_004656 [Taxawa tesnikishii (nom. ined.)]|nr:hypothetical protein H2203_004656 [Dothideales sp. JES 119]
MPQNRSTHSNRDAAGKTAGARSRRASRNDSVIKTPLHLEQELAALPNIETLNQADDHLRSLPSGAYINQSVLDSAACYRQLQQKEKGLSQLREEVQMRRNLLDDEWERCYQNQVGLLDSIYTRMTSLGSVVSRFDPSHAAFLELEKFVQNSRMTLEAQAKQTRGWKVMLGKLQDRLSRADTDFVIACQDAVAVLNGYNSVQSNPQLPVRDDTSATSNASTELPEELELFYDKVGDMKLLQSQRAKLHKKYCEKSIKHDLLADQDGALETSDEEFIRRYPEQSQSILDKYNETKTAAAKLRSICLSKGYDINARIPPQSQSSEEPEPSSTPSSGYSTMAVETTLENFHLNEVDVPAGGIQRWLAEQSMPTAESSSIAEQSEPLMLLSEPSNSIERWEQGMPVCESSYTISDPGEAAPFTLEDKGYGTKGGRRNTARRP